MIHNGNPHPTVLVLAGDALRVPVAQVGQLSERRVSHLWDGFFGTVGDAPIPKPTGPFPSCSDCRSATAPPHC